MQALIKALLEYSRVGTRGKELVATDCRKVMEQTLSNLKGAIAEAGAVVSTSELPTVKGDATQLGQLFQNLIGNAIKFCRDGKPQIRVSAERKGGAWLFAVKDNGIGIDRDSLERIFEIFQRLHTQSEYPGTGIGLALCKKIVQRHGGTIWVESEPDSGSTFLFTIPAAPAEVEGSHDRQTSPDSAG
jgi:light-regulated signal transduction histidine kinase (bacteriophytochrome)